MKKILLMLGACALLSACAAPNALNTNSAQTISPATHTLVSAYDFDDTVARLERAISAKGMTIFTVIDHKAAAQQAGLDMQPAKVIVFGTPKAGTPLMQKDPAFALQLPLKVLITQIDGRTTVHFFATEHLIKGSNVTFDDVKNTLANAEKLIKATVETNHD